LAEKFDMLTVRQNLNAQNLLRLAEEVVWLSLLALRPSTLYTIDRRRCMPTNLSIQLSAQALATLANEASALGTTPGELAASVVESIYAGGRSNSPDANAARARFEQCLGSVNLGRPIGIANQLIDADLETARMDSTSAD
jgi:hypothetical protein